MPLKNEKMQKLIIGFLFIGLLACSQKEEKTLPLRDGYLDIYKSEAFAFRPPVMHKIDLINQSDTLRNGDLLRVRVGLQDSVLRNLAKYENLKYDLEFYYDSTDEFTYRRKVEEKQIVNDNAMIEFLAIDSTLSEDQILEKDWSVLVKVIFSDDRGHSYDTAFSRGLRYYLKK